MSIIKKEKGRIERDYKAGKIDKREYEVLTDQNRRDSVFESGTADAFKTAYAKAASSGLPLHYTTSKKVKLSWVPLVTGRPPSRDIQTDP